MLIRSRTGLIPLCGVRACRSNLCELEKHTIDPDVSNPFESSGKYNVSCPYPPSERGRSHCKADRRAAPSDQGADSTRTAVDV